MDFNFILCVIGSNLFSLIPFSFCTACVRQAAHLFLMTNHAMLSWETQLRLEETKNWKTSFVKCGLYYPASKPYAFAMLSEWVQNHLHYLSNGGKKGKGDQQVSEHESVGEYMRVCSCIIWCLWRDSVSLNRRDRGKRFNSCSTLSQWNFSSISEYSSVTLLKQNALQKWMEVVHNI